MSREYLEYLHDLFSAFAPIATRAMFGGHGIYRDGLIIGILIDEAVYLKMDAQTRPLFEAEGCAPFMYEARGRQVPMSYWSVPEMALDSPQDFRLWAQLAWEAALRKPKPKPRAQARKATPKPRGR